MRNRRPNGLHSRFYEAKIAYERWQTSLREVVLAMSSAFRMRACVGVAMSSPPATLVLIKVSLNLPLRYLRAVLIPFLALCLNIFLRNMLSEHLFDKGILFKLLHSL